VSVCRPIIKRVLCNIVTEKSSLKQHVLQARYSVLSE